MAAAAKGNARGLPPSRRGNRAATEVCRYAPSPEQDRFSAYHEAGHAVAASVLEGSLVSVDIHRKSTGNGHTYGYTKSPVRMRPGDRERARRHIMAILAGPLAEGMVNPDVAEDGTDANDRRQAFMIAAMAICQGTSDGKRTTITPEEQDARREEIRDFVCGCLKPTEEFLNAHKAAVAGVASALLSKRSLTAAEVAKIISANPAVATVVEVIPQPPRREPFAVIEVGETTTWPA